MDIQNILSFGAKKRIEKRLAQYQVTFDKAEKQHKKLEKARKKAIVQLGLFVEKQKETVESIQSIRKSIYNRIGKADRLTVKILKSALKKGRKDLLNFSLTEHQIYTNTISQLSYAESLGITIAGMAAGTATAVGVSVGGSVIVASSTGTSVAAATSITSAGVGHLSWMAVGTIALPLSVLFMAGFNHWNANDKIKKINLAEEDLLEKIDLFKQKQLQCLDLKLKSSERSNALMANERYLTLEFDSFSKKCEKVISQFSRWKKIKAHISLFLGIKNKDIEEIILERNKLKVISSKIYDNLTKAVA